MHLAERSMVEMANISPFDEYTTFSVDITTITENEKAKDIINSSKSALESEDLVQDALGNGNILEGFD